MKNIHFKNTREVLVNATRYIQGKTLDFGAGTAKYKYLISPHSSSYTAFDMIPDSHVDVVGDVLNAPFPNESFTTIISTQVLEHVEKPWVMAHEIARLLEKGGICIVTAPFMQPYHADPYDFFRYTKKGMESLFRNEGLEIIESGTYGRAFSIIADMINFSLFSRYAQGGRSRLKGFIASSIERVAHVLDMLPGSGINYSNVYVIAKKP